MNGVIVFDEPSASVMILSAFPFPLSSEVQTIFAPSGVKHGVWKNSPGDAALRESSCPLSASSMTSEQRFVSVNSTAAILFPSADIAGA